jgi:radical SAM protein with 4Fe4S-binding SPASM domain
MRIETRQLAEQYRSKLWDVVPLDTPWSIYIDITNLCNFKCIYCPTGNPEMIQAVNRRQSNMSMRLYKKLIDDMGHFKQKIRIVNLYKDGDPLVNKNFCEMVQILRDADVTDKIYSKTNGELIPRHPDLAACDMNMLGVSVPHVRDNMIAEVVGKPVNYQKYKDGIKRLYEDSRRKFTIATKIARYKMTDEDIDKFYKDFESISDTVAVEGLHGWGAKDIKDMFLEDHGPHDGVPINYKLVCPLPFYLMSVNSDGTTAVCCAEWGHFHDLGDTNKNTLKEIWEGKKTYDFQMLHLEGRRFENAACKDCQYRDCLPDNVDDHRLEMIERIKNA